MQEIIKKLTSQAGLTEEQAKNALQIIVDFVGEKYPVLKGQVSNLLGTHHGGEDAPQIGGIDLGGLG